MSLELLLAGAMLVSLTFYALLGGADYGGGVWDLFARGSRAKEQRALIAHAIGPIPSFYILFRVFKKAPDCRNSAIAEIWRMRGQ